ncbi:hypothetical protein [Paraliomyxa miuraensis]|uniref:hypothetical protein n=1 Tax=Paraliomyxa miuraensis TaxID=376150 RepID=UPI00225892D9|nr:hypothetical protein [Paraliomyxa miuraensis]MCX4239692.1 hypothetical protein [Paraliomyxa miuraensis]
MRSKGLVVMAAAGLVLVLYAFYVLLDSGLDSGSSRPEVAERSGARSASEARGRSPAEEGEEDELPQDSRERRGPPGAKQPTVRVSPPPQPGERASAPPSLDLPPRPEPEISLEEARTRFGEVLAELDRLSEQNVALTSPQWVDYYKRGNDALLPLQQHLDVSVPDQADELRRANEDLRAKLRVLEPNGP